MPMYSLLFIIFMVVETQLKHFFQSGNEYFSINCVILGGESDDSVCKIQ